MMRTWRLPVLAALLVAAAPVRAQTASLDIERPAWSPLRPIADMPRSAVAAGLARMNLLDPAQPIGLFWLARNPAALPGDVESRRAGIQLRTAATDGSYRRPLDPGRTTTSGAGGFGWQPAGESSALAGGFSFDEVSFPGGTRSTTFAPYATTPFVVTDTSISPNRFLGARFEGAAGWQMGRLGLGLSAGYESIEGHSQEARIPRRHSFAMPGIAAGAVLRTAGGRAEIGVLARGTQLVEISQIANNQRGEPFIRRLNGFATPEIAILDRGSYFRRREVDAQAVAVHALATARQWRLLLDVEAGRHDEGQFSERVAEPPTDRWKARSRSVSAAAQGMVFTDLRITGHIGWSDVRGDAHLADSDSTVFRAVESVVRAAVEARRAPTTTSPWGFRAHLAWRIEDRDRGDTLPFVPRTRIESRLIEVDTEVSRRITGDLALAVAIAQHHYAPRGSIPPETLYPAGVRDLVAGETAYLATPAWRRRAGVQAELVTGASTALRLHGWYESYRPARTGVQIANAPTGSRNSWGVSLGMVFSGERARERL